MLPAAGQCRMFAVVNTLALKMAWGLARDDTVINKE